MKETRKQLEALARNLWWTWQPDVVALFQDLDPLRFASTMGNALAVVRDLDPSRWRAVANDEITRARIERAYAAMERYLSAQDTWGDVHASVLAPRPVAYFSAEFGVHESFPIYSGGLGILAGDHLKSASDLGVPVIGVGMFYREGYFSQRIARDGTQEAIYPETDPQALPLTLLRDEHGAPAIVQVPVDDGQISLQVWSAQVGRSRLLLLDASPSGGRVGHLESRLYSSNEQTRLLQEIVLGIGGVRALALAGIDPGVIHLNEGHSALAVLELARREAAREQVSFAEALEEVSQRVVFTTHTPVPAGHDRFHPDLIDLTLRSFREEIGIDRQTLLSTGRVHPERDDERFCMTVLAMKHARSINGVSALHGRVTRKHWRELFPGRRIQDEPIGHITNGIHTPSWVAPEMHDLLARKLGQNWTESLHDPKTWSEVNALEDLELWAVRRILKRRLVRTVRAQLALQYERWNASSDELAKLDTLLDPDVLTIGFGRRFATYKRADLLFLDLDRATRLIVDADRPVQVLFAGKAHPADTGGQDLIKRIVTLSNEGPLRGRVVFLEHYNVKLARSLVQGVDLWLNTPRRPLEACGTSGMKAVVNGALNMSVLDGWWPEAYDGQNGFAIDAGGASPGARSADERDATALLSTLETKVVPMFYERDDDGIPRTWLRRIRRSLATLAWRFNTDRMVREYTLGAYLPAADATTSAW